MISLLLLGFDQRFDHVVLLDKIISSEGVEPYDGNSITVYI